ncbi:MAG: tetratricopeptide repeat protein [Gemmatimonadaceae bacterium]|nr:tetratricopeptide repeat protein [Gemmatimonadaceae bacterium]
MPVPSKLRLSSAARAAWVAALLVGLPAAAGAQSAPDVSAQCDVDESKPTAITFAQLSISKAASAPNATERQKAIREGTKRLGEMRTAENPAGKAFAYGKFAVLWLQDAATPDKATFGDFNIPGDKAAVLDVTAFADSNLKVVETLNPKCEPLVAQWRTQQAWFRYIQAAFAAIGQDDIAKAEDQARRSLLLNTKSAYAPYILSNGAARRYQSANGAARLAVADTAFFWMDETVKQAGSDTVYGDIKKRTLLDASRLRVDIFETAVATDLKTACAKYAPPAAASLVAFTAETPNSPDAPGARSSLSNLHLSCGDTAKAEAVYDAVVKAPTSYGDIETTSAGVLMSRINRAQKAMTLFEGALAVNPAQRDALNNLAATYYTANKYTEMMPVVTKLVQIDPNNPDNWLWYAYAYQGLMKPLKPADPKRKLYSDSLSYYNNLSETMPLKVSFSAFSRGDTETKLAGTVEFRQLTPPAPARRTPARAGAKPAAAAAAPATKDITMTVEFLDKAGAVVEQVVVPVGAIKAGETKEFQAATKKPGAVAFRYAKLS